MTSEFMFAFRDPVSDGLFPDAPEDAITVTVEPYYKPWYYLWFKQSLRNTAWLLVHGSLVERWRTLIGRCRYCGRTDCID